MILGRILVDSVIKLQGNCFCRVWDRIVGGEGMEKRVLFTRGREGELSSLRRWSREIYVKVVGDNEMDCYVRKLFARTHIAVARSGVDVLRIVNTMLLWFVVVSSLKFLG